MRKRAVLLGYLDKIGYRLRERIERMKEADSFNVELFAIDLTSNGDD